MTSLFGMNSVKRRKLVLKIIVDKLEVKIGSDLKFLLLEKAQLTSSRIKRNIVKDLNFI